MNRRGVISSLALLPWGSLPARSQLAQPYKVTLLSNGKTDRMWAAGVLIELDPDWKTYWRMPGDAGIPPQFDWTGSKNVEAVTVSYPIPGRFKDLGGEMIGYHDKVLFPLSIKPQNGNEAIELNLNLFFAVCREICIPASTKASLPLQAADQSGLVATWQARVPQIVDLASSPVISNAIIEMLDGRPSLMLQLRRKVDDIFVETETSAYFTKPEFDGTGLNARMPILNIKDLAKLRGASLKLTLAYDNVGIEQMIVVN